ncbi:MAG: DNA methyltransferase [Bacteroidota bacterium]
MSLAAERLLPLRDAAATDNKSLAVHRWVPWIAGFSANFVEEMISVYLGKERRERHWVLDPFAGVATTMVEALKAGCNAIGCEINPFAALAARAKVSCVDVSVDQFKDEVEHFRCCLTEFEAEIDRYWNSGDQQSLCGLMEKLKSRKPPHFHSRIPFFSPPVEAKFLYSLQRMQSLDEPARTLFKTALGATMVCFSNYTYEPSLSSRPGAGKPLIDNASVADAVCAKLSEMLDDIRFVKGSYGSQWQPRKRTVYNASYFDCQLPYGSISLIVTSPPYMNNYHYIRNTRPQLYWLDLINDAKDLHAYEHQSFGKFWQTVRQSKPISLQFPLDELSEKIESLRSLNAERGAYGGPGWANYVATYFNDTKLFLERVKLQLTKDARAIIVVGNSIIQGIEFRVDEYFAMVAELVGLKTEGIEVVRTKRVGTSILDSSVRKGQRTNSNHGVRLYDAAVILKKNRNA